MNRFHWSRKQGVERAIGAGVLVFAVLGPLITNSYWSHQILIQTFIFGIAGSSLVFLAAYGGMISLAQTALLLPMSHDGTSFESASMAVHVQTSPHPNSFLCSSGTFFALALQKLQISST